MTRESLRMLRNHKRVSRGLGPGTWPGPAHRPRPLPPLLWFLSILRLSLGLQYMNYGSQAANSENLSILYLKSFRGVPPPLNSLYSYKI